MHEYIAIGLDISTTKVGLVAFDPLGEVVLWDYLNLSSTKVEKDLVSKTFAFSHWFGSIFSKFSNLHARPTVYVEAPLFISGYGAKTNANTMAKLIAFNWMVMYALARDHQILAHHVNVNSARKKVFGSIPKDVDKKVFVKDRVCEIITGLSTIPKKYQDDIADAYVVGRSQYVLSRKDESSEANTWVPKEG